MEEKKQNEEVQSRREFFKKTARIALPLIGGIIIGSSPSLYKKAVTKAPAGCMDGSCSGGCKGGCDGKCFGGCEGCRGTCGGGCHSSSD